MLSLEDYEEIRQDRMREAREEYYRVSKMEEDIDYFIEQTGFLEIQDELERLKKLCDDFDYDFYEIISDLV